MSKRKVHALVVAENGRSNVEELESKDPTQANV